METRSRTTTGSNNQCLNEGWPECGMETVKVLNVVFPSMGLNEGWPECGMETVSPLSETTSTILV